MLLRTYPVCVRIGVVGSLVALTACARSAPTNVERSEDARAETDGAMSPQTDVVPIMHAKLGYTHAMLDAIALRDFLQIEANAMALMDLSEASDWQVHDTVSYRIFSERFREAVEDVAMQARNADIDAVSRAYVRLMTSCVDCHSYLHRENLTKDMPGRVTLRD